MRLITILLFFIGILFGCNRTRYVTVKHVKPVNRNSYYNKKKDRKKKRVKYVRVKILKESKYVKAPREKKKKEKKQKEEEEEITEEEETNLEELEEPTNEPDSTGLF